MQPAYDAHTLLIASHLAPRWPFYTDPALFRSSIERDTEIFNMACRAIAKVKARDPLMYDILCELHQADAAEVMISIMLRIM